MKLVKRFTLALVSLLAFAGVAYAQSFTVSDVTINPDFGESGSFLNPAYAWIASADSSIPSFNLSVGQSKTFTYGLFYYDIFDDNGKNTAFDASFKVQPPTSGATVSSPAIVGEVVKNGNGTLSITFTNPTIDVFFGTGGEYSVTFDNLVGLDPACFLICGSVNLQATIDLMEDSCSKPVPEPGTLFLLWAGMFGVVYLKRRING